MLHLILCAHDTIRYDTIRDAMLACAEMPFRQSLAEKRLSFAPPPAHAVRLPECIVQPGTPVCLLPGPPALMEHPVVCSIDCPPCSFGTRL